MTMQLAKKNVLTIQLLSKGDTTIDDAVTTQEKWQQYVDSYTLVSLSFLYPQGRTDIYRHIQRKVWVNESNRHSWIGTSRTWSRKIRNLNSEAMRIYHWKSHTAATACSSYQVRHPINIVSQTKLTSSQRLKTTSIVRAQSNSSRALKLKRLNLRILRVTISERSLIGILNYDHLWDWALTDGWVVGVVVVFIYLYRLEYHMYDSDLLLAWFRAEQLFWWVFEPVVTGCWGVAIGMRSYAPSEKRYPYIIGAGSRVRLTLGSSQNQD